MPFDPTSPLQGGFVGVSEYDRPSPPFLDTLGAAFRQENLIGSYLTSARREVDDFYKVDPAYNPFDDLKGYEDYADRFESAFNPNAAAAIKADIDKEKKDREILAASGWTGVGLQMGAAIADPTILIPGGALVKAGRLGYRTGRSAASIGAAAGIGTAVQEAGLQATQEIRPGSESALAVGGSVLLGGLVGAAGAKFFSNAEWNAFSRSLREDLASEVPNPDEIVDTIVQRAQSAGAAAVGDNIKLDDLGVGGPRIAQAIAKATAAAKINPGIQTMLSPSKKVRETYTQLVDNPIYSRMNMEGETLGADVENLVKEYQRGMLSQWVRSSRDLYKEAKAGGFTGTKSDFYEAIAKAGRRGDVDPNGNEFVTRAAQEARAKVFNPLLKRAQALGLLPEDIKVETAASYVTRLWSRETLIGREDEFRSIARDYFRKEIAKVQNVERGKADKAIRNLQSEIDELETGILRRGSETAEREAGGEVDFSLMSEDDIVSFIKKQKQRPKEPERLSQWLKRQRKSGIYDPKGELSSVFPDVKAVPGLLRKSYKGSDARGGDGLDDIVLRAWEDGFLNDAGSAKTGQVDRTGERPTIRDFLDALSRDVGGDRVVRIGDLDAARAADDFDKVMEALDRAGVNFEKPKFGTSEAMKDVAKRLNRVLDDIDRERIAKARQKMAEGGNGEMPDFVNEADLNDYIEEVVSSVFNNLTGRGAGDVPAWLVPVKRGPLKERTFKIADALVEDFLENDMELIMRRYTRVMGAEVGLAEKFGRADMKDQLDAIGKDYEALRKQAKTPQEREKLTADEKRDRKNLEAFRDMIRGTYRAAEESSEWSRLTRGALAWNYMRLLGGVTLTSLTDASRLLGVHGVRNTMKEALPALVSNTRAMKIAKGDARDLGVVSETVLQTRLASLADLNDPYAYGSKFDRYLSNATNLFSKATGLAWWNDTMKMMASVMTQNRILKNAANWEKAGERERAYMAFLGINEDMAQRIAKQFEKHGVEENGIRGANISQWDDEIARRAYAAALAKDVDRTIITKGVADTPLWMKTNWGKLIMQFKSFGLASHQRTLIAGLQERPQRLAEQLVFATAIGMLISYLKFVERGDMDEAERLLKNPGLWIANGLDRTGILSLPFEVSNTAEKLGAPFGITTALQKMAGDEDVGGPVSRYASRNKLGAVLGPSAGLFQDLATIAEQMSKGDMKKSGANAIIRQIPGATLPGVRTAIHVGIKPALVDAVE